MTARHRHTQDGWRLSRRRFVGAGAGLGAARLPPGIPGPAGSTEAQTHGPTPTARKEGWKSFKPGAPLAEPEVRRSANGVLQTTLRMQYAWKDIGGYRLYMRTYEGTIPGPTLRVKPGDTLRIKLVNDLPPNRDPAPAIPSHPHNLNTTNFHSHGLHVSRDGMADNVLRTMEPGQSHDIEIAIPADHVPGTNWYHPHHHGSADVQLASGCVGALIIDGDFAGVPEIAAARERTLVMTEAVFDAFGTIEDFATLFPENAPRFLAINGMREPTITMRPGEVQRWRVLHAGWQDDIFVELAGHTLNPIARDGIALSRMGLSVPRDLEGTAGNPNAVLFAPGQRVDLLVKAGAPGAYALRAIPYNQGYQSPTGPLARVVVEGDPLPMSLPASLPPLPEALIGDRELTGRRTLTLSASLPEAPDSEHWREYHFMVDGRTFDPNRVDQRVRLGAVEEWTVVNDQVHDHVFHIHINDMLLVK